LASIRLGTSIPFVTTTKSLRRSASSISGGGKVCPHTLQTPALAATIAWHSGQFFTGATPGLPTFGGLKNIFSQSRLSHQSPWVIAFCPRSIIVNTLFASVGLLPLPVHCNHKGIERVARFIITVSVSGASKPVVRMATLQRAKETLLTEIKTHFKKWEPVQ